MKKSLLLFFISIFLILPPTVNAQKFSLAVAPSSYEVISKTGQTIRLPYSFTNTGDPTVVSLQVFSTYVKDSKGTLDILPIQKSMITSRMIFALSDPELTLETPFLLPSQRTLGNDLTITIPEDMPEGDYLVSLVISSEKQSGFENEGGLSLAGALASPILITVTNSGAIERNITTNLFHIKSPYSLSLFGKTLTFIDSFQPVPVIYTVVNSGKNAAHARGAFVMKPFFQKTPDEESIQKLLDEPKQNRKESDITLLEEQTLYASTQKTIVATKSNECEEEDAPSVCTSDVSGFFPGKLAGLYRVSALLLTDMIPKKTNTDTQFVLIFPFTFSIFIGVVLLTLLFIIMIKEKKLKK